MNIPKHFTTASGPVLSPRDATAALLVLPGERYLMQRRDDLPNLFYAGHWCCFGGAIDEGEVPLETLRRELLEELELEMPAATEFGSFSFELAPGARLRFHRTFYEVRIQDETLGGLKLHEGAEMRVFKAEDLLLNQRVAPYDGFAVWAHAAQGRLSPR